MNPVIRRCTVQECLSAPNLTALLDEYAKECSIAGIGQTNPQFDSYKTLEAAGLLRIIGAFDGERLIGFVNVMTTVLPHYGKQMSVTESLFCSQEGRSFGIGSLLILAAESLADEIGSAGLMVSAPVGGRLEKLLPHVGYAKTNSVFFKATQ